MDCVREEAGKSGQYMQWFELSSALFKGNLGASAFLDARQKMAARAHAQEYPMIHDELPLNGETIRDALYFMH